MTIQEALERGKQLRKVRDGAATSATGRFPVGKDDTTTLATLREQLDAQVEPGVDYAALDRVEFDADSCEENCILLSTAQLGELGQAAAAIRLMRGRVLHRVKSASWSSIGITSPGPGEGKTVTSLNLAISIAIEKQRPVYLLDFDMRNPSVWSRVGVRPGNELSQFLRGDKAPHEVLYETSVDNLIVAGNADAVTSASELLSTPKTEELLLHIRRRSRGALIIIDLPPVLSTDEALIMAPRIDAMFLVVSEGVTRRDGIARSVDLLSDFTVAGLILNRSSEQRGRAYDSY